MTAHEFIAWTTAQPKGARCELVDGEIYAMASQRSSHALAAFRIARRLAEGVEAAGLDCTVYPDGMPVEIDATTVYEPDAIVRCGPQLPGDAVRVSDPLIVVEVLSPSTRAVDTGLKLAGYFRIASLRHYLVMRAEARTVVHHARDESGAISTRIIRDGPLTLEPPGIELRDLFG
jgi:Uma2 family endonuclease